MSPTLAQKRPARKVRTAELERKKKAVPLVVQEKRPLTIEHVMQKHNGLIQLIARKYLHIVQQSSVFTSVEEARDSFYGYLVEKDVLKNYDPQVGSEAKYLARLMKNYLIKEAKNFTILQRKMKQHALKPHPKKGDIEIIDAVTPLKNLNIKEKQARVQEALRHLIPKQRELIRLRHFEGKTLQEIGDMYGIKQRETIRMRLVTAEKEFTRILALLKQKQRKAA